MSLEAETWAVARRVCTPAELRALRKREDLLRMDPPRESWWFLAEKLGVSQRTARDRVSRAEARIRREVASR